MKLTYSSVRNPRWATPDHSVILCLVKFDHLKQEAEFAANPNDCMSHGREIFGDCANGKYGPVADFKSDVERGPTPPPTFEPQLHFFKQWPEVLDFLNEANKENASGTIRGQVLVWSSMIEVLIGRLLSAFLIEHKIASELLESSSCTFSVQIDLAFSLGLISKSEHRTCHKIRDIRNHVAHSWSITLLDKKVYSALKSLYDLDHADTFVWIEEIEFLVKMIYAGSCGTLALRLAERQIEAANRKCIQFIEPNSNVKKFREADQ